MNNADPLTKLYIEITTACNLDCQMCVRRIWDEPSNAALRNLRGSPENLRVGDVINIPPRRPGEVGRPTDASPRTSPSNNPSRSARSCGSGVSERQVTLPSRSPKTAPEGSTMT